MLFLSDLNEPISVMVALIVVSYFKKTSHFHTITINILVTVKNRKFSIPINHYVDCIDICL